MNQAICPTIIFGDGFVGFASKPAQLPPNGSVNTRARSLYFSAPSLVNVLVYPNSNQQFTNNFNSII